MTPDPNRKSLRQFHCRDYLWDTFEQMSSELDCSIDFLFNEALRQYARSHDRGLPLTDIPEQPDGPPMAPPMGPPGMPPSGYPGRAPLPGMSHGMSPGIPQGMRPPGAPVGMPPLVGSGAANAPMYPSGLGGMPPLPGMAPAIGAQRPGLPPLQGGPGLPSTGGRLPSLSGAGGPPMAVQGPPMMPPGPRPGGAPNLPPMIASGERPRQGTAMGVGPGAMPGPLPGRFPTGLPGMPPPTAMRAPAPIAVARGNTLIAVFEGQSYPVTKEEFVIGRGNKSTDLTIRDSNVSRRHACVMLHNGQYWIMDQQSTNGVEFNGARIASKVIEDGDLYKICDHEIRFMYR